MRKLRKVSKPLRTPGGKGNIARRMVRLLPPHEQYVEVFGGGAALLFSKPPSKSEVYNDVDSLLVNFFRVLRDPEKFAELERLCALTPFSREEHRAFSDEIGLGYCPPSIDLSRLDPEGDVGVAHKFFTVVSTSMAGSYSSFGVHTRSVGQGVKYYLNTIEMLPLFHERVRRLYIEHMDFRYVIEKYDGSDVLFYLDPPYPMGTRADKRPLYKSEMTDDDHLDMVDRLLAIKGKALLSCYWSDLYKPLVDAGWSAVTFDVPVGTANKKYHSPLEPRYRRREVVLISPNAELNGRLSLDEAEAQLEQIESGD